MNVNIRRPITPLQVASPAIRKAIDEFERLVAADKFTEAERAWQRVVDMTAAFKDGAAFAARVSE